MTRTRTRPSNPSIPQEPPVRANGHGTTNSKESDSHNQKNAED